MYPRSVIAEVSRVICRYSLGTSFEKEAANAVMDLTGDEDQKMRTMKNAMKW